MLENWGSRAWVVQECRVREHGLLKNVVLRRTAPRRGMSNAPGFLREGEDPGFGGWTVQEHGVGGHATLNSAGAGRTALLNLSYASLTPSVRTAAPQRGAPNVLYSVREGEDSGFGG